MALFRLPKPLERLQESSIPFEIIECVCLCIGCIQFDTQIQKEISKPILYTLVPLVSYPIFWMIFHLLRKIFIHFSSIKLFSFGSKISLEILDAARLANQKLIDAVWILSAKNENSSVNNLTLTNDKGGTITINGNIHVGKSTK